MASTPRTREIPLSEYPTSDGKPMGETPLHGGIIWDLLVLLRARYAADPTTYISGNMLMYYVRNDRRRHVCPDVFVAFGIGDAEREAYFTWVEGKGPDVVFEITSRTTRREDVDRKFHLYRDTLGVREYFLFDPKDYLRPSMQGFRLDGPDYVPIPLVDGRLTSVALGLQIAREGRRPRLYDLATGRKLLLPSEENEILDALRLQAEERRIQAEEQRIQAEEQRIQAEARAQQMGEALRRAEEEQERLRREIEDLRRRGGSA